MINLHCKMQIGQYGSSTEYNLTSQQQYRPISICENLWLIADEWCYIIYHWHCVLCGGDNMVAESRFNQINIIILCGEKRSGNFSNKSSTGQGSSVTLQNTISMTYIWNRICLDILHAFFLSLKIPQTGVTPIFSL